MEKEEFRLGYSKNPDFLRLKTRVTEPIKIWFHPFAGGDSYAGITPIILIILLLVLYIYNVGIGIFSNNILRRLRRLLFYKDRDGF